MVKIRNEVEKSDPQSASQGNWGCVSRCTLFEKLISHLSSQLQEGKIVHSIRRQHLNNHILFCLYAECECTCQHAGSII